MDDNLDTEVGVRRFISRLGGEVVKIRRGKHWVVHSVFDGKIIRVVIAVTASDPRAIKNTISDIRKRTRGDYGYR